MVKSRILIISFLVGVASSCHSDKDWYNSVPLETDDIIEDVEWISIPDSVIFSSPQNLLSLGEHLIVSDRNEMAMITIIDERDGKARQSLRKGRSSYEVLDVHQLLDIDGHIGIVDAMSGKILLMNPQDGQVEQIYGMKDFSSVCYLGQGLLTGTLNNGKARYGIRLIDSTDYNDTFGDYSEYGLTNDAGWGFLQGHLASNGKGKMIWCGYYNAAFQVTDCIKPDIICSEILNTSDYHKHESEFITLTKDTEVSFISVSGSEKDIFVLYDGKTLSHYMTNKGELPSGKTLFQLDWDGKMTRRYESSLPISCIAYNGESKALYLCVLKESGTYGIGKINTAF